MHRSPGRQALAVLGVCVALVAVAVPGCSRHPDGSGALRRDTPFVPLFTEANDCGENTAVNNLAAAALQARLAELHRWFVHFHAEASDQFLLGAGCQGRSPTTLATKLAAG